MAYLLNNTGAVVIGRNEGERLQICLRSLITKLDKVVYVDSGSTDTSVDFAKGLGLHVIELDLSTPFTAARARNEGFKFITTQYPKLLFVQFIDGDCELVSSWLNIATHFLYEHPNYAVVCGRRQERYPERSIYNQLCDMEWDTLIGDADACGGDALIRVSSFSDAGGYNNLLIAGEEPELCFRLRQLGWKIYRLDQNMTLHDAAMNHFRQWWMRSVRSGHAFAESMSIYGDKEKYLFKETRSIFFWAGLLPILIIILSLFNTSFMMLFVAYPLQIGRMFLRNDKKYESYNLRFYYSFFVLLARFPQIVGAIKFYCSTINRNQSSIIEYK
ncbi:glycosyl transferase [Methylocucumis oryzae]|uniref:Glycosyl transferase n=2 Tax=Methylocucumis oryzae TaxID=1632867 RepID=A0A0F3IHV4_9GAMM|nr:glycosyl transferase [Methylocucumis oryzae]